MFSYYIMLLFSFLLQTLSAANRANLLDDMFSLADAGQLEYNIVLNISEYLTEEYHALPWMVAKSKFMAINTLLASSSELYNGEQFQAIYQLKRYKLLFDAVAKVIFTHIHIAFLEICSKIGKHHLQRCNLDC